MGQRVAQVREGQFGLVCAQVQNAQGGQYLSVLWGVLQGLAIDIHGGLVVVHDGVHLCMPQTKACTQGEQQNTELSEGQLNSQGLPLAGPTYNTCRCTSNCM
eukprot:1159953-Pelagomonas_calceolata.AAC.2